MLFVIWVLLFGGVRGAELVDVPIESEAPVDPVVDPVMLEIMNQNNSNVPEFHDDKALVDIKTLVGTMSKGDARLTAFIIKQLLKLQGKTRSELKIITARIKRKLKTKTTEIAKKVVQDKKASVATAAYAAEVINSRFERLQVNRELRALDRIMEVLNSMSDWKSCPSGWKQFGRSCYRLLARKKAYLAEGACLKVGGSLIRVDNPDDKKAVYWYGKYKDTYLILGFFRSLKTGNWMYLDGTEVNVQSWYRWYSSYHNNKQYNYVRYYGGYQKVLGCHFAWTGGPLCEHRLAVNLKK